MGLKDIFNALLGRTPPEPVFPPLPEKTLSQDEARGVFDALANMENVAHGYPQEGCSARAHLMCRALYDMGIPASKAWAFEEEGGDLIMTRPNGDKITWWYHVAPALPVLQGDGKKEFMVFDPAMFDGPVTLQKWGDSMGAPLKNRHIVACGEAPPGYKGDYNTVYKTTRKTDKHAQKTMKEYLPFQDKDTSQRLDSGFVKPPARPVPVQVAKGRSPHA